MIVLISTVLYYISISNIISPFIDFKFRLTVTPKKVCEDSITKQGIQLLNNLQATIGDGLLNHLTDNLLKEHSTLILTLSLKYL